jgi:hypothetical protein
MTRTFTLYLRSRLAGRALALLAAIAALTWFALWQGEGESNALILALVTMPLAAAVVLGASARSPFGEAERAASRSLPALRLAHLASLLALAGAGLALAAAAWGVAPVEWQLARNLAGYAGLAWAAARVFGAGVAWVAPLGYGALALIAGGSGRWAWPSELPNHRWSVGLPLALGAAGLAVVALGGARDAPGEAE